MTDLTNRQTDSVREQISQIRIIQVLEKQLFSGGLSPSEVVQTARLLLDKSMPSLSSIEQTLAVHGTLKIAVKLGD